MHCIGVDPYDLEHGAGQLGYHPQAIQAGRRINGRMGKFVAGQTAKAFLVADWPSRGRPWWWRD